MPLSRGRLLRRIVVLIVGGTVALIGVIMLFTPGPAILVIPAGLAILATEYGWARELLERFRRNFSGAAQQVGGWWSRLAEKFTKREP